VPPSLGPVKAVAAGSMHTCVITQAGGVACFGNTETNVPVGLEGATAVAAGSGHSCALNADGAPVCWGANGSGQLTPPPGLKGLT
jgi:alpha-tubulin suppressor-like RCC1 family protein